MAFLFGACPKCFKPLHEAHVLVGNKLESLPKCEHWGCRAETGLFVFPAYKKIAEDHRPEAVQDIAESSCIYHPEHKAASICSSCGAFICKLCEIKIQDDPICPTCLNRQMNDHKQVKLKQHSYLWDNISLAIALIPIPFFWYVSFITAPICLYISIRYWNTKGYVQPLSKIKFSISLIISFLTLLGWIVLIAVLIYSFSKMPEGKY